MMRATPPERALSHMAPDLAVLFEFGEDFAQRLPAAPQLPGHGALRGQAIADIRRHVLQQAVQIFRNGG